MNDTYYEQWYVPWYGYIFHGQTPITRLTYAAYFLFCVKSLLIEVPGYSNGHLDRQTKSFISIPESKDRGYEITGYLELSSVVFENDTHINQRSMRQPVMHRISYQICGRQQPVL